MALFAHRCDQVGDQFGLGHQAGAEPPSLHAIGRAADIEIDLVVTELGADARGLGKCGGIAAADLQGNGMLIHMKPEQPVPIAAQHGIRRHHLGVEQRALGDEPQEVAAVPVGPLHHGRDAEAMFVHIQWLMRWLRSKALAPAMECLEHGAKRFALLGKEVLIAGRMALV